MGVVELKLRRRAVRLHKASRSPDFKAQTVLSNEPWEFVAMWLRRHKHKRAGYFWEQARQFQLSAMSLPPISAPLPSYYSMLNAVKCLLLVRGLTFADLHGMSGASKDEKASLESEVITLTPGGVFGALLGHLARPANARMTVSLKKALYNLPYVHRAFCVTFSSVEELYLPISAPRFVRKASSEEAWLEATLPGIYATKTQLKALPSGWERDNGVPEKCVVRMKKRFKWKTNTPIQQRLDVLAKYHAEARDNAHYIAGSTRLWYLKKNLPGNRLIVNLPPLLLSFAAMHRLSELARYSPDLMARHFDSKHNWLLSEFIKLGPLQFLDESASEITGTELLNPGVDSRPR